MGVAMLACCLAGICCQIYRTPTLRCLSTWCPMWMINRMDDWGRNYIEEEDMEMTPISRSPGPPERPYPPPYSPPRSPAQPLQHSSSLLPSDDGTRRILTAPPPSPLIFGRRINSAFPVVRPIAQYNDSRDIDLESIEHDSLYDPPPAYTITYIRGEDGLHITNL